MLKTVNWLNKPCSLYKCGRNPIISGGGQVQRWTRSRYLTGYKLPAWLEDRSLNTAAGNFVLQFSNSHHIDLLTYWATGYEVSFFLPVQIRSFTRLFPPSWMRPVPAYYYNIRTKMIILWVVPTIQDERFEFYNNATLWEIWSSSSAWSVRLRGIDKRSSLNLFNCARKHVNSR